MEHSRPNEASSRGLNTKVMGCKPKVLSKRQENEPGAIKPKDTGATKKIGGSSNRAVCGMENRRPMEISVKKRENFEISTIRKHPYLKSKSEGNLAGQHIASKMERIMSNKANSGDKNASKMMGCKPKVLPAVRENVPGGIKTKSQCTSKKMDQEIRPWDLRGKLRCVTAQLKEAKEEEKELKHKLDKLTKEIDTEEQQTENIKLSIPDDYTLELKKLEVNMIEEQLKMCEQQFLEKQREHDGLKRIMSRMELESQNLDNRTFELRASCISLNEKIRILDLDILRAKSDTNNLDEELEIAMHEYEIYKSFLVSLSSEVKILEDCAKEMEMGNFSLHRGLRKPSKNGQIPLGNIHLGN